jgi:hypothetical protein
MYTLRSCKFSIRNTLLCRLRKKDKLDKFWKEKSDTVHAPRSVSLLFLSRTEYKIFRIAILHDGSVYCWLHPGIFPIFFETFKFDFF